MADFDGETDILDLSGNGAGVALNVYPRAITRVDVPYAVSDFKNGKYSIGGVDVPIEDMWMESPDQVNWGPWDPATDIIPGSGMTNMGLTGGLAVGNRGPVSTPTLWAATNPNDGFTIVIDINPERASPLPGGFSVSAIDADFAFGTAIVTDQRSNFVRHIRWDGGASYSDTTPITTAGVTRIVTTVGPEGTVSYLNTGLSILSPGHPASLLPLAMWGLWTKEGTLPNQSFLECVTFYPYMNVDEARELARDDSFRTLTGKPEDNAALAAALAAAAGFPVTADDYYGGDAVRSTVKAFTIGNWTATGIVSLIEGSVANPGQISFDTKDGNGYGSIGELSGTRIRIRNGGTVTGFQFDSTPYVNTNQIWHAGNFDPTTVLSVTADTYYSGDAVKTTVKAFTVGDWTATGIVSLVEGAVGSTGVISFDTKDGTGYGSIGEISNNRIRIRNGGTVTGFQFDNNPYVGTNRILIDTDKNPTIQSVVSAATVTPTFANDQVNITALAVACQLLNPTGTAVDGWGVSVRIKDNGTGRALTYDTQYRAVGVTLPSTTVANKTLYLGMIFNQADTKWDVIAVAQEA